MRRMNARKIHDILNHQGFALSAIFSQRMHSSALRIPGLSKSRIVRGILSLMWAILASSYFTMVAFPVTTAWTFDLSGLMPIASGKDWSSAGSKETASWGGRTGSDRVCEPHAIGNYSYGTNWQENDSG